MFCLWAKVKRQCGSAHGTRLLVFMLDSMKEAVVAVRMVQRQETKHGIA